MSTYKSKKEIFEEKRVAREKAGNQTLADTLLREKADKLKADLRN